MKEMMEPSHVNLAIVGGRHVGKSALTVRFLTRRFIGEYDSKADVCVEREIQIAGTITNLHIKDTAGCDWVKGPSALIGWANALVIVYSVTDNRSFEFANFILRTLKVANRLDPNSVLLLGNKTDLEHVRMVSQKEGKELALKYGINFQETSAARDCDGVDSAFRKILVYSMSCQMSKGNLLQDSSESLNNNGRKLSGVVRDRPERRSIRRVSRRPSISSAELVRDSLSSVSSASFNSLMSEEDKISLHSHSSISPTLSKKESPSASPTLSQEKRRKISLPKLLEKLGRHYQSQKYLFLKMR